MRVCPGLRLQDPGLSREADGWGLHRGVKEYRATVLFGNLALLLLLSF